MVLRAADSPL